MTTPVARTMDVLILPPAITEQERAWMKRWGQEVPSEAPVSAVPIPEGRVDAARFLSRVLPGHTIEHLGRASMVALRGHLQAPSGLGTAESWAELVSAPTSLFFQSLAFCFSQHHPFALRPEVIGYLVNHEVAETVKRYPDQYRALYTKRADGSEEIEVRDDSLAPGRASDWGRALGLFEQALRKRVPDGIMDAMLPDYSTATVESRVASLVTFMDAASPFFTYGVRSMCGIPRIRLLGTAQDWQRLLAAARKLAEPFDAHLGSYFKHLLPVLKTIADQADPGAPIDNEFWASIYKLHSVSGGDRVTGWSTALVRYLKEPGGKLIPKDPRFDDWTTSRQNSFDSIGHDHFPIHLSTVPFIWKYLDERLAMKLVAGVLGVDDDDGFVTPSLSYAVVGAPE